MPLHKIILKYALPIIALVAIVSRLPQLISSELIMDGDECIVGLMAKHYMEGKGIPFFFYGQSYGFSFIEVFAIRIFYSIFGVTDIAVKSAMLLLWTTGIVFFYKVLKEIGNKNNPWLPLLITLVFVFSPAWGNWAMKARGGYLTAFVLTSVVTYLIFNKRWNSSVISLSLTGLLIMVIYQSQPLFLAGLFPLVLFQLYQIRGVKTLVSFSFGLLVGVMVFFFIKAGNSNYWSPPKIDFSTIELNSVLSIPKYVYWNLEGSYLYTKRMEPILITSVLALVLELVTVWITGAGIVSFFRKRELSSLFYVSCISVMGTIGYVVLINGKEPRYLLPLSGYALLMIYLFLNYLDKKKVANFSLGIIILFGMVSMYDFKNYPYESKSELAGLVNQLESSNNQYVLSNNPLLQWQIMFYSNERIIGRFKSNVDRYQEYVNRVNQAFKEKENIALVGYDHLEFNSNTPGFNKVNSTYFILENPTKETLIEQGFNIE